MLSARLNLTEDCYLPSDPLPTVAPRPVLGRHSVSPAPSCIAIPTEEYAQDVFSEGIFEGTSKTCFFLAQLLLGPIAQRSRAAKNATTDKPG